MKRRSIIFLHHRSGSTVMQHFLHLRGERSCITNLVPPCVCYEHTFVSNITNTFDNYHDDEHVAISTHQGNWWGNLHAWQVPEPYMGRSPNRWDAGHLVALEKANQDTQFRYLTLLRDGRNTVASLFNLKGGIEEKLRNEWGEEDYFRSLCLGWRNQARVALDNQAALPDRYKIFRFEDLMTTPIPVLGKMFAWMGYQPDWEQLSPRIDNVLQRKAGPNHTSFKDDKTMHQRYLTWYGWQMETFWSCCRKEMIELGYNGECW